MDQAQQPCPGAPMDQGDFERVWRRVMPEDRADCPFTLEPNHMPQQRMEPAPPQPPAPVMPACPVCLGAGSQQAAPDLEQFIRESLRAARTYQFMARQAGANGGRTLGGIAADKARQAKRLGAAYFLITGATVTLPACPTVRPSPLPTAIRQRFQAEQSLSCAYRAAAESTQDACLADLYRELSDECDAHAQALRGVLERL